MNIDKRYKYVTSYLKLFLFMLLIPFALNAQSIEELDKDDFFQLSDDLYIGKYEVSNKDYNVFLDHYSSESVIDHVAVHNQLWTEGQFDKSYNKIYKEFYHIGKKWENHPVVNISQNAAKAYCIWLTDQYAKNEKTLHKKVVFRLPTEKEWMSAYKEVSHSIDLSGEKLKYTSKDLSDDQKKCNELKYLRDQTKNIDQHHVDPELIEAFTSIEIKNLTDDFQLRQVRYVSPSSNVLILNMVGNASEWLYEENRAIASNWNVEDNQKVKKLIQPFETNKASPLVGFRIVMEVVGK